MFVALKPLRQIETTKPQIRRHRSSVSVIVFRAVMRLD